jgi:hypothetical protein
MLWNQFIGHVTRTTNTKEESKAILGWKRNYLTRTPNGYIQVKALAVGIQSGLNSEAICYTIADLDSWSPAQQNGFFVKTFKKHHKLVGAHCTCGFYAYPSRAAAEEHPQESKGSVLLEVAISGKFMQHKKGFRYAHQRVTKIVVDKCGSPVCTSQAVLFLKPPSFSYTDDMTPSCLYHSVIQSRNRLSFEDVSAAISSQPLLAKFPPIAVETANGEAPWVPTPVEIVTKKLGKVSEFLDDSVNAILATVFVVMVGIVSFASFGLSDFFQDLMAPFL